MKKGLLEEQYAMNPPARPAPDLGNEWERGKGRKILLTKNVLNIVATKP
jgi:hypothetical protein